MPHEQPESHIALNYPSSCGVFYKTYLYRERDNTINSTPVLQIMIVVCFCLELQPWDI